MTWIFIALAITLLLLDIWVATQFLSHLALLVFAGVAASFIDSGWEWRITVFIACYLAAIAVYYLAWKQVMAWVMNTLVAPTRHRPEFENIIGARGPVVQQRDMQFARINGILWPIQAGRFPEGSEVVIESVADGKVVVTAAE